MIPISPSCLTHLKPCNPIGWLFLGSSLALSFLSLALAMRENLAAWLMGQSMLAFALMQWFVVLHECGHETLFRSKSLNLYAGHLASIFCLIPFLCWKPVHRKHHKWTGWQDVDPTTALLVPGKFGKTKKAIIHVCWKFWIPLFSVIYRIQNFWNFRRLQTLFQGKHRLAFFCNILCLLTIYIGLLYSLGIGQLVRFVGLGFFLSLLFQDLLLLSQHTHMPLKLSGGERAQPCPPVEQEVFTRSLKFPRWFSICVLLNMDAHELHHMYPFVPGFSLRHIPYTPKNEIGWWRWIREAKRLRGEVFLLQNRNQSGAHI
jgi:acyl-lipid omega-6 desaturase (Delta-12 desaturase)